MGRTVPNMFATIPGMSIAQYVFLCLFIAQVNFATYLLVDRSPNSRRPSQASLQRAVALLVSTAVIFRAEVALLLTALCLQLLFARRVPFMNVIRVGLVSGVLSIGESYIASL